MVRIEWLWCWICYRFLITVPGSWIDPQSEIVAFARLYGFTDDFKD